MIQSFVVLEVELYLEKEAVIIVSLSLSKMFTNCFI